MYLAYVQTNACFDSPSNSTHGTPKNFNLFVFQACFSVTSELGWFELPFCFEKKKGEDCSRVIFVICRGSWPPNRWQQNCKQSHSLSNTKRVKFTWSGGGGGKGKKKSNTEKNILEEWLESVGRRPGEETMELRERGRFFLRVLEEV